MQAAGRREEAKATVIIMSCAAPCVEHRAALAGQRCSLSLEAGAAVQVQRPHRSGTARTSTCCARMVQAEQYMGYSMPQHAGAQRTINSSTP